MHKSCKQGHRVGMEPESIRRRDCCAMKPPLQHCIGCGPHGRLRGLGLTLLARWRCALAACRPLRQSMASTSGPAGFDLPTHDQGLESAITLRSYAQRISNAGQCCFERQGLAPCAHGTMQARTASATVSNAALEQSKRRWRSACARRRTLRRQASRPPAAFGSGDPSLVTLPVFPLPNVLHPAQQGMLSGRQGRPADEGWAHDTLLPRDACGAARGRGSLPTSFLLHPC